MYKAFSLSKKALLAVTVILFPVLVTFIFGYQSNKKLVKDHILEDLTIISEAFEGQVYQFLELSKRRTQDFASDGFIRDELDKILAGGTEESLVLSDYLSKNKLLLDRFIHTIHIIGLDGRTYASTNPASIGRDFSNELFFKKGRSSVKAAEFPGKNVKDSELVISAPLFSRSTGKPIGVIAEFMFLSELDKVFSGEFVREYGAVSWGGVSNRRTMEVYLVNKDKLMITRSRFLKDSVLSQTVDTEPVNACLGRGKEITGFYKDYSGVDVVGSSMCLPSMNWTFLVEIDADEALSPVNALRKGALVSAGIIAGLIGLLFIAFYKNIVLQLRRISEAAGVISKGDYDVTIPVITRDEIGALSESFNKMASDIRSRSVALKMSEEKYRSLISNIPDVTWTANIEGKTTFISPNVTDVFGYTPEEVYQSTVLWFDDIHPEDVGRVFKAYEALFRENARFDIEYRVRRKDGQWIWLYDRATSTYEKDGIRYADGVCSDITERKKADEALKESEDRLKRAQHVAHIGSWDWDIVNDTLSWSDEIYRIFGLTPRQFGATYEAFINSVHPEDRDFVKRAVKDAFYGGKHYSVDHRIVLPDGTERIVHEEAEVVFDDSAKPVRMIGTVQDLTERKRAEFELKKLSTAIEHSVNIVFVTDIEGKIEYANPMFEQVTGFSREEVIGQTPRILASGETSNQQYEELWRTILSGKTWKGLIKNKRKNGGYYWCNVIISPIRNERGETTNFLAVQEDITDRMLSEEKIKYLAQYDELTGLINRTRFIELLEAWISYAQTCGQKGALCFLDMDQFKILNDTLGHGAGDEYLRRVAKVLSVSLESLYKDFMPGASKKPILSRLSGDEFALFLPSVDHRMAIEMTDRLRGAVEGFHFAEANASATVSAGVALYPEHGVDSRELFTRADAAMYRAKELGRNRTHLYRPEDKDLEKMLSRLSWKERILKALKEDRFEPWFQPILDLKANTVSHYEVLARLREEDGNILLPGAFIDIAERFGLVGSIDRMIIKKAIGVQAELRSQGKQLSFGMNLSGKDLGDDELLEFIKSKIVETGADPGGLIFEITETAAIGDLERAIKFIRSLRSIGCHFALDDFGVGFTSFTYLREMQVDYIKIDGSFIRKLHENPDDQVFVKAITGVARGLKIKSVAEFVETEETLNLLKEYGVDFGQGYLIGKPGPLFAYKNDHLADVIKLSARTAGKKRL